MYVQVVRDSAPVVIFLSLFIIYFSWVGNVLFAGTLQGTTFLQNKADSAFNMLVLMTTSNYPDVMLPAY